MTAQRGGVAGFVEKNLWAVVASAAALWSGYLSGQMTTQAKIDQIDARTKALEERSKTRGEFMSCAVRTLDKLVDRSKVETPCELKVAE